MSSVISVENLSKKYIIGHQKQERYTALRNVSDYEGDPICCPGSLTATLPNRENTCPAAASRLLPKRN